MLAEGLTRVRHDLRVGRMIDRLDRQHRARQPVVVMLLQVMHKVLLAEAVAQQQQVGCARQVRGDLVEKMLRVLRVIGRVTGVVVRLVLRIGVVRDLASRECEDLGVGAIDQNRVGAHVARMISRSLEPTRAKTAPGRCSLRAATQRTKICPAHQG